MDQNRSESILDQVIQALEDEKAQLEGKLEAEIDVSERQKYESRLESMQIWKLIKQDSRNHPYMLSKKLGDLKEKGVQQKKCLS